MNSRTKAISGIIFLMCMVLVGVITSAADLIGSSTRMHLKQRANEAAGMMALVTEEPILKNNHLLLDKLVTDMIRHEDIAFISIEQQGTIIASAPEETPYSKDLTISTRAIGSDTAPVGRITLGIDNAQVNDLATPITYWVVWSAIGAGLATILIVWFMFYRLTRPLRQLQSLGRQGEEGSSMNMFNQDEVQNAVETVNRLTDKLQSSYTQLQASLREQKHSYVEARQIEEKNKAIYGASLDAIIVLDDQGIIIEFNQISEQIFGWKRDDIVGKAIVDHIVPPSMRLAHNKGMAHFLETGEGPVLNQRLELSAMHSDGTEFPIEISICPAKTAQGYLFVSYIRDITQQLRDKTELRLAAHAFDSNEAIYISDAKGQIIRTNNAFTRITGYAEEEMLGQKPRTISAIPHDVNFHKAVWFSLLSDGKWRGKIMQRRKNGETYEAYLSVSAEKDKDGKISHCVGHFFDMSKHFGAEEIAELSPVPKGKVNKAQ